MHRNQLLQDLEQYERSELITDSEKAFLGPLREFIRTNPKCFDRENPGHITGSAWIINEDGTKALLTHHRKLNLWLQLGGHADGDPNVKNVALREAQEESGIEQFTFVIPTIFDIDIHPIPGNCVAHYDIRYLLRAPQGVEYVVSEESHDLGWIDIDKIAEFSSEPSVLRMAEKGKKIRK